jgi:transcriptional regulator with XRE-family HTH domain/tetratricopeptide (TPR) repeat protein
MYSCQVKWSSERNVRSKQENTFGACGQEKAMLPVSSIGGERGVAHRWELRSIDPTSSAIRQLGDTLYNLRITAGLTQQQLAARTGGRWSRSHIGRVENGDVTPSPDFVEAMDGLLDGDRTLVKCLPLLLLETARQRSQRQWQRREAWAPPAPNLGTEELPELSPHTPSATPAQDPALAPSDLGASNPNLPGPGAPTPGAFPKPASGPGASSSPASEPHASDRSPFGPWAFGPRPPDQRASDQATFGSRVAGPPTSGPRGSGPPAADQRASDQPTFTPERPRPDRPDPERLDRGRFDFEQRGGARPEAEPPDQESMSTANRSQFLRMTLWAGLGAVLESVRLTLRVEGAAGGPVSHEQLELAVEQYARAYWATPAGVLFEQVRQCRQLVDGMLDQHQPASRRRHLHLVAGWLSALLGNLSFHLGDYTSARMHLGTAWRLGQAADHNGLVAWVRGAQSMVELYDDHPEEALRMAREGQTLAPNPLVRAQLASWGEARALARMGDRRGVLEAIARGSRAIESSEDDWSPGGVFSFSVGEFEQYCGTACLWLDLPNEAKRHADHAFELRDTVAAKALARLDIAAAESQLGRPAEASQIGAEVLQMPAEYLIDPIVRRATELATALEPHSSLAEVRDFNDRLASLVPSPRESSAARSAGER